MDHIEVMANEIRSRFKECGSISFWGSLLVWPHDAFYSLVDVRPVDDGLLLLLKDDDGRIHQLEISGPVGVDIHDETNLVVQMARQLRFNGSIRTFSRDDEPPALVLS